MNNTLVLHTGGDRLEQEYAKYISGRVGGTCTGLSELGDISSFDEIICIFRYASQNAALPEAVEDLLFERAGEIAGKKVKFVGFGERSDGFREAVEELSGMCGVEADCRFLKETARIYTEHTDGEDKSVVFVRSLRAERREAGQTAAVASESGMADVPSESGMADVPSESEAAETPENLPAEDEAAETPAAAPSESGEAGQPASAEIAEEPAEEPGEVSSEEQEPGKKADAGSTDPETYMDEAALAAAVRAVIAESEEMISQVTDEVSAEFPDEEEAEDEEPSEESYERDGGISDAESGSGREDRLREAHKEVEGQVSWEAGGPVRDGGDDSYDDWDPGKDTRSGRDGGEIRLEEPQKEHKEEPAGEILPKETVQEEPSHDTVGQFSWELKSGETLRTYIRRANGEEPWPAEEYDLPKPKKEPQEGKSYRFVDESVTLPEEAVYEAPLGLSDLEALEAEEAAEEVNRRERRKERTEREEEPEEGIIARAAARILAFFRGSRDEDEELDFDDEEKEPGNAKSAGKSFFDRLRDDVGVYDEDDEDFREDGEEPQSDYDEDDEEEFEDDEDFSDSFEEEEDEEDF